MRIHAASQLPDRAPPPIPSPSVDFLLLLFASVFIFLTAAAIRLVPWSPRSRWPLRANTYAAYGATDPSLSLRLSPSYETLLELGERIGTAKMGFTDEQIDILPTYILSGVASASDDVPRDADADDDQPTCVICREAFQNLDTVCILPCACEFHALCIGQWLRIQASCPLCRCRFA